MSVAFVPFGAFCVFGVFGGSFGVFGVFGGSFGVFGVFGGSFGVFGVLGGSFGVFGVFGGSFRVFGGPPSGRCANSIRRLATQYCATPLRKCSSCQRLNSTWMASISVSRRASSIWPTVTLHSPIALTRPL